MPKLAEGSEHEVYLRESDAVVLKLTRYQTYGESYFLVAGLVHQQKCTLAQYLVRLHLWDKLFGSAPIALGICQSGQIVSRQKYIQGDIPTQDEVDAFLEDSGLADVNDPASIAGPLRAEIEQRRSAAQATLHDHRKALQAVQTASDQLDQGRAAMSNPPAAVAAGLTPEHVGQQIATRDGQTGQLRAVGLQKVAFSDGDGNMKVAPIGDTRLAATDHGGQDAQGGGTGQADGTHVAKPAGPPAQVPSVPAQPNPPNIAGPSPEEKWTQQSIADAMIGKKSYGITPDGEFQISPTAPLESLTEAVRDGVVPNPGGDVWDALTEKQKQIDADRWSSHIPGIPDPIAEMARDPNFDPVGYYVRHPSPEALATAREVFKARAQLPTDWAGAVGGFVKAIPSSVGSMAKAVYHGLGNVATEVANPAGSPAAERAKLENASAAQAGLVEGRNLAVGLGRNIGALDRYLGRVSGMTNGKLSDREIEERIQSDAAWWQVHQGAESGDIERPGWVSGQGTMNAGQLARQGQAVRPDVIRDGSFAGNPATVLTAPLAEAVGPLVSRFVTAPVSKAAGRALATTERAAVPTGQSVLGNVARGTTQGAATGTVLSAPFVAAAQSPREAGQALGGGFGLGAVTGGVSGGLSSLKVPGLPVDPISQRGPITAPAPADAPADPARMTNPGQAPSEPAESGSSSPANLQPEPASPNAGGPVPREAPHTMDDGTEVADTGARPGAMRGQIYVGAEYHHQQSGGAKNPPPADGQTALLSSVSIKGEPGFETAAGQSITTRRISVEGGTPERPYVVLDWTRDNTWHGHVLSLEELKANPQLWQAFRNRGLIDKKGTIQDD